MSEPTPLFVGLDVHKDSIVFTQHLGLLDNRNHINV